MEIIQEIGSYAGFAAVVGLAVLSALYFSQARDVKRLREWAGRAPERTTPEPAQPQRVVAQPIARPPQAPPRPPGTPAPVPRPPGAPTPAQASATGAAPAVAKGPAPATPAGERQTEAADSPAEGEEDRDVTAMDTVVHPPPQPPAGAGDGDADEPDVGAEAEAGQGDTGEHDAEDAGQTGDWDASGDRDDDTGEWSPEDEHGARDFTDEHDPVPAATPAASAVRPPQPPRPFPRRGTPVGAGRRDDDRTAVLPTYAESRPEGDGGGRRDRSSIGIAAIGLVGLAIAAFVAFQAVTGGGEETDRGGLTPSEPAAERTRGPIDPSTVTVAVLNGTTVPGLAAAIGDRIAAQGFDLGTVTNNFDQERAESVVLYAAGSEREAAAVGRRLDIGQREPIDPTSQSLAGDASVVVVAGADQTQ